MISYQQALETILKIATPINNAYFIDVNEALGFVNAQNITCKKDLPAFNNAAMDGYAFKFDEKNSPLTIKATIFAGETQEPKLGKNECYKIMTGAPVPNDADTIAPFEETSTLEDGKIQVSSAIKYKNAFRFKGEEQAFGSTIIKEGVLLEPSHIMLLASQGIMQILVYAKPKVAIISTGDELREPWDKADKNSIYNCNGFGIHSILRKFGFESKYCGVIPDDLEQSTHFFKNLKARYDVIISSGGISMGEADFVKEALKANGFKESFHGVNLKPGRPLMTGVMDESLVISLPGNPMAAFLNTYLFVLPALRKKSSWQNPKNLQHKAINQKKFTFKPNRTNIILGRYEDGNFTVTRENRFGSGMITPITESNALALSDENRNKYEARDTIEVIPL